MFIAVFLETTVEVGFSAACCLPVLPANCYSLPVSAHAIHETANRFKRAVVDMKDLDYVTKRENNRVRKIKRLGVLPMRSACHRGSSRFLRQ